MAKVNKYNWCIGEELPTIEDHSKVKLDIIESEDRADSVELSTTRPVEIELIPEAGHQPLSAQERIQRRIQPRHKLRLNPVLRDHQFCVVHYSPPVIVTVLALATSFHARLIVLPAVPPVFLIMIEEMRKVGSFWSSIADRAG